MFLEQEQQKEIALEMQQGRIFPPREKAIFHMTVFHLYYNIWSNTIREYFDVKKKIPLKLK